MHVFQMLCGLPGFGGWGVAKKRGPILDLFFKAPLFWSPENKGGPHINHGPNRVPIFQSSFNVHKVTGVFRLPTGHRTGQVKCETQHPQ